MAKTKQEIIENILNGKVWWSFSSLKALSESPKKLIQYKTKDYVQTEAQMFGELVHCKVLEPHEFEKRYYVMDNRAVIDEIGGARPTATKVYKEWVAEQQATAKDRKVISIDEHELSDEMVKAVMGSPAGKIIESCTDFESKLQFEHLQKTIIGYIDGKAENFIADLKVVQDANPKKVQRDIFNNKYHVQAGAYCLGEGILNYYIIAVDRSLNVSVHRLSNDAISKGMATFEAWIYNVDRLNHESDFDKSHEFHATNDNGIFDCELPPWER